MNRTVRRVLVGFFLLMLAAPAVAWAELEPVPDDPVLVEPKPIDPDPTPTAMPPGLVKNDFIPPGLLKQGKTPAGWSQGQKTGWFKGRDASTPSTRHDRRVHDVRPATHTSRSAVVSRGSGGSSGGGARALSRSGLSRGGGSGLGGGHSTGHGHAKGHNK